MQRHPPPGRMKVNDIGQRDFTLCARVESANLYLRRPTELASEEGPLLGQTLSHYHVTAALGAGGMGEVYRATDTKLGRDVAIKILPAEVAKDPERLARFQREAHLLASLNHPHIAAIHGLEEANGQPFLVLELVEGGDLKTRLERSADS